MTKETGPILDHGETALVRCSTTKGPIVMEFHRDWAPHGYDRAIDLFEKGASLRRRRPGNCQCACLLDVVLFGVFLTETPCSRAVDLGQVTMTILISFE
jgi:hypothetical protein